jgi:two-component system NarL family sensor kinase
LVLKNDRIFADAPPSSPTEEHESTAQALRERLKEITCLYEIHRRMGPELPVEDVCQQIFEHLIPAMRYPQIASAMIELDGRRFTTPNHGHGRTHELQSIVTVKNDGSSGRLRVFYPEDTPFRLPEDQRLIDAIARDLERWLKEITCLYEIRRGIGLELSVDNVCQRIFEHLIPALQFPESATAVIELDGRRFATGEHEQGLTHELHSKISVDNKSCGQMRLFYPVDRPFLMPEEQRLIDAVASDLERWLERKHVDETLQERLKEVTCLYEIRRGLGLELSPEHASQHIFEHLIPAMQFPERASAMIELDGRRFFSEKHGHSLTHELQSKITVNNTLRGQLWVFYPEETPFLVPEEQRLIDGVADDVQKWLEGKRLEQTLVSLAEEHQRSVGQELHDNLGQQIAAIGYQAEALEIRISAAGIKEEAAVAASIAKQAQAAATQCKQIAQGLLPFELETHGLMPALQALALRIATTYRISCDFVRENEFSIVDNDVALNLYRIAQEALNNAIRHSNAKHLVISLAAIGEILRLSICDDGKGFSGVDTERGTAAGMGIKIMHYRARQIGAKLKLLPRSEGGTEVRLEMPMIREG